MLPSLPIAITVPARAIQVAVAPDVSEGSGARYGKVTC